MTFARSEVGGGGGEIGSGGLSRLGWRTGCATRPESIGWEGHRRGSCSWPDAQDMRLARSGDFGWYKWARIGQTDQA